MKRCQTYVIHKILRSRLQLLISFGAYANNVVKGLTQNRQPMKSIYYYNLLLILFLLGAGYAGLSDVQAAES